MEKVKLPMRIKVVAILLIVMGVIFSFLNPIFPDLACLYHSFLLFILGFSYFFFPILLLRRIKWAWYGTVAIIVISIISFLKLVFLDVVGMILDGHIYIASLLIYIVIFILPHVLSLIILLLDREKYFNIAALKISSEEKKINILIIIGLLIIFTLVIVSAFIKVFPVGYPCWFMGLAT
jgi:hypothetical protein